MTVIKRLPVYASGVGFTVAIVAVAEARHWSGWLTLLVALAVGVFYVLTIVVPWLIREQTTRSRRDRTPRRNGGASGDTQHRHRLVITVDARGTARFGLPETQGPAVVGERQPQAAAR